MKLKLLFGLSAVMVGGLVFSLLFHKPQPAVESGVLVEAPSPGPSAPAINFNIPILMYHYIRFAPPNDDLGTNLSVSPDNFRHQMDYLKKNNYQTVMLSDLADPERIAISKAYAEKKKPVVITFDDGYTDAYTQAFPVLKTHGFFGTFFMIRYYTGRPGYLSQKQIDEMKNDGMEIGSHTLNHLDLSAIADSKQQIQIVNSKEDSNVFCYPSGKYGPSTRKFVEDAGYVAAVTTHTGIATENSSLFELPRVRVSDTGPNGLASQISYAHKHPYKNGN